MKASAAIAETKIRTHCGILSSRQDHIKGARLRKRGDDAPNGWRAHPSDPRRTARVRLGASRLRAPVSQHGSAISRRTLMNNAGSFKPRPSYPSHTRTAISSEVYQAEGFEALNP